MTATRLDPLDYFLNRLGQFGKRAGRQVILPRKPLFIIRRMPAPDTAAGLCLKLITVGDQPVTGAVRLDRMFYSGRGKLLGGRVADSHRLDNEHVLTAFPDADKRADRHEIGRFLGAKYVVLRLQRAAGAGEIILDGAVSFWREREADRQQRWQQLGLERTSDLSTITDPSALAYLFEQARTTQDLNRGFDIIASYQKLRGARTAQRALAAIQFSSALRQNGCTPRLVFPDGKIQQGRTYKPFLIEDFDFSSGGLPDSLTDFQLAVMHQTRALLSHQRISFLSVQPGSNLGPRIMLGLALAHRFGLRLHVPPRLLADNAPIALTSWCRFNHLSDFLAACRYRDLISG